MGLNLAFILLFAASPADDFEQMLPFEASFIENATRYDIRDFLYKMTFREAGTDKKYKCRYSIPGLSTWSSANLFGKDKPKKTKSRQKIYNAFSDESFKVTAASISEKVDTLLGETIRNDVSIEVLDYETRTRKGFVSFNVTAETVVTGNFKKNSWTIKELTEEGGVRLPLRNRRGYPVPTTGYFTFHLNGELVACLVLHPRPINKAIYSLYIAQDLETDQKEDTVSMMLLFPMLQNIGSRNL